MQERPAIATDRPGSASQAPEVRPDTPTVQDDWRAALAEALKAASAPRGSTFLTTGDLADALLPTLRWIVAEELRAAAADSWEWSDEPGTPHNELNARADRLDATPDHGKA